MKKIKVVLFTLLLCFSVGEGFAQVNRAFPNFQTYVDVVVDFATLNALSHDFSVDYVKRNPEGTFDTRICLSFNDYDNFLAREIPYSVVQPTRATVTMANSYAEMTNGWNRYPTYNTYLAMMDTFQTRYPNLCKIDTILASTPGGRKILCAHISNNLNDNMGKPSLLYISTMHGDEVVGYYYMLRLIDMLLSNYNTNTKITNLVNNIDIWICPLYNPDGTYHTSDNQINTNTSSRYNHNNVDLNRNFPEPDQSIGSINDYQQKPEVWAMMQFMSAHNFTLAANFHGGAEVFNYPWDTWRTSERTLADVAWWQYVGRKYVDTCRQVSSSYMTDTEDDGITEGGDWYVITGSMQDYHNWFLGTRHVTIEVSSDKVLSTSSLPNYWNYSYHSLLNLMEEAGYGIHGTVTDSRTGQPLQAKIYVENHDVDHSYVETTLPYGDYHRPIKAGTYSVTYSADGYFPKTIVTNVLDGVKLIQDVQLDDTVETCKRPMDLVAANVTATTASLSWTERGTASEWVLQYGTDNTFVEGTYNVMNVTNTPAIDLVGLTTGVDYYARVKAVCDAEDESGWCDLCAFQPTNVVTIGTGTATNSYLPTYNYYKYSLTEQIYTADEIGTAGTINRIAFYNSGTEKTRTLDIYMKGTAKSTFSGKTDWVSMSNSDKVYSGSVTLSAGAWTFINFSTPFEYDGSSNIVLAVDDNTGSNTNSPHMACQAFNANGTQSIYICSNYTNYNPLSPTTSQSYNYATLSMKNHILLDITASGNPHYTITASANPSDGGTVSGGGSFEEGETCTLIATANTGYNFVNWTKNGTQVSTAATYTFTVTASGAYVANFEAIPQYTVTIAPNDVEKGTVSFGSRGGGDETVYDFEDGWQGWTTFQGSTTSQHSWMHNTAYPTNNNDFSTGYGYDNSNGFMLSESYISGTSSGSGTSVTPDNYLVSPQIRLGGSISFYAGARNTSYCAEKFSVMVSTTDNTNPGSFTTIGEYNQEIKGKTNVEIIPVSA